MRRILLGLAATTAADCSTLAGRAVMTTSRPQATCDQFTPRRHPSGVIS